MSAQQKWLTVKVDITNVDVFQNILGLLEEILKGDALAPGSREHYTNKLLDIKEMYENKLNQEG